VTGRPTHLVESDQRKAAFLGEVARATGVAGRVQIHTARIESLPPWPTGTVTARALAALPELLDWAAPFLAPGTICLFPKGAKADDELTAAERVWTMKTEPRRSVTDPSGLILRLSNIERRGQT
jgi:16S rRNA (guanine527-N7)-methyltransferase